jgi:hypothetical protein
MTKSLESAFAAAKKLSDEEQDVLAAEIMATLADIAGHHRYQLSDQQVLELRERLADPDPHSLDVDEFQARLSRLGG